MVWRQRKEGLEYDIPDSTYDCRPKLFTIKIHHGGYFDYIPYRVYIEGKVDFFDFCNGDAMSIQELQKMVSCLGYNGIMFYHYKVPTMDLEYGLRVLASDVDMMNLVEMAKQKNIIEIYLEHGQTLSHHTFSQPPVKSSVLIKENDENEDAGLAQDCEKWLVSSENKLILKDLLLCYNEEEIANIAADFEKEFLDELRLKRTQEENEDGHEYETHQSQEGSDGDDEDSDYNVYDDSEFDWSGDENDDAKFEENIDRSIEWAGVVDEKDNNGLENSRVKVFNEEIDNVDSDYASSCDLWSIPSSDDGDDRPRTRGLDFRVETDMKNPEYKLKLKFSDAKEVKQSLREYSIKNRRDIYLVKNDKRRIRAKCRGLRSCPWVILISPTQDQITWEVKTFVDKHTCGLCYTNKNLTSEWVAKKYTERFRVTPDWSLEGIMTTVREDHHIDFTKVQAYRAKRIAEEFNNGNHLQQYGLLWDYCEEIMRTNPNSTMKIDLRPEVDVNAEDERKFRRIYCCLGALKAGFAAGCRNVLGLDGCFLKGPHSGQVLTAIGFDANNGMYPLAYAVVESETRETWQWFLEILINDIDISKNEEWVFISDQQKGLDLALKDLLPAVEHRYCLLHMYNNYKKLFKGKELKDKMYRAAFATNLPSFNAAMKDLKENNPDAFEWVSQKSPVHWSRSHFTETVKCDALMNNICESFNGHIVSTRDKPIITLLEMIRNYLMVRIRKKREELQKCDNHVLARIQKTINKTKQEALDYICTWNGGTKYQLRGVRGDQYVVDLSDRSCTCRKWQLSGIPCKHGISAIFYDGKNGGNGIPELWVHDFYKLECQARIYEHTINPINGPNMWPQVDNVFKIVSPKNQIQPGRPKKARNKSQDEPRKQTGNMQVIDTKVGRKGRVMTCSKCGNKGHNSRICKGRGSLPVNSRTNEQEGSSNIKEEGDNGRGRGRGRSQGTSQRRGRGTSQSPSCLVQGRGRAKGMGQKECPKVQIRSIGETLSSNGPSTINDVKGKEKANETRPQEPQKKAECGQAPLQPQENKFPTPKFTVRGSNCVTKDDLNAHVVAKKRKVTRK